MGYEQSLQLKKKRFDDIMTAMKVFMNARRHQDLYCDLLEVLPDTFGFEFASVLFSEDSESLYTLNAKDLRNVQLQEEDINKLPKNMGLSGLCIQEGGPMSFMDGEDDHRFCLEVDNVT